MAPALLLWAKLPRRSSEDDVLSKRRRGRSSLLDLHTAVAVSMLPVSRLRASAVFRELRHQDPHTTVAHVLDALRVPAHERRRFESEARSRADAALAVGAAAGMDAVAWFDSRYPALLNCV